jgi:hypothetical protein
VFSHESKREYNAPNRLLGAIVAAAVGGEADIEE